MGRKAKAILVGKVVLGGFLLSVLFHFLLSLAPGRDGYPYDTFLFQPSDRFMDFSNIFRAMDANGSPYQSRLSVYFPAMFLLVKPLTFLRETEALFVFLGIFFLFVLCYVYRSLAFLGWTERAGLTLILSFLSYPILFTVDRANLECWLFICTAVGVSAALSPSSSRSVFPLGLATAMKGYPGVFLLLHARERRHAMIFFTLLLIGLVSVVAAATVTGGIEPTLRLLPANLEYFKNTYLFGKDGLQHNASLYGMLRVSAVMLSKLLPLNPLRFTEFLIESWPWAAIALAGAATFFLLRFKPAPWKSVAILVFLAILLPQVSFDYKLVHLLIPLLLFLQDKERTPYTQRYAILFGVLMIPKDYAYFFADVSIAVVLNPLLMVLMTYWIVREQCPNFRISTTLKKTALHAAR